MVRLLKVGLLLVGLGLLVQTAGRAPRASSDRLFSTASPIQRTAEHASPKPESAQVPAGYVKVFGDEFNEPRLDTRKWWTRYIYDGGKLDFLNDEQQRYREANNHVMTGHSLMLTARKTDSGDAEYSSGMIRSKATFQFGYFEAKMKIPGGVGVRPAFWLNSARRVSDGRIAWPPEIDIAEVANNGVEDTTRMLHVGLISNGKQAGDVLYVDPHFRGDQSYWLAPESLADDFHIFSALWEPDDTVSVFVDGRLIEKAVYKWVYDDGSPAGYAHVILDLAIGGQKWAGRYGVDATAFPQGLEVDYLRVYQKHGEESASRDIVGHDLCPPQGGC